MERGSDESPPPRRLRRFAHLRALHHLGFQSGRRQTGVARGWADCADRDKVGDRSRVRRDLRAPRQTACLRDRRDGGGGNIGRRLFTAEFMALFESLRFTAAARATVFIYAAPFFVAVGAAFLLKDERLKPIQWAGLGLAFVGVACGLAGQSPGGSLMATRSRFSLQLCGARRPSSSRPRRSGGSIR